ncbi:MAG: adenylyltransferase/cytidyltransferase family protein [Candidatus Acidiferrales bacterium]
MSHEEVILQRQTWKRNGESVACVGGAFDLLHPGHVRLIEQARALADRLIVIVIGDEGVRAARERSKPGSSAGRPVNPASERAEVVAALASVDSVAVVEGDLSAILGELKPDVFAFGISNRDRAPAGSLPVDPNWAAYSKLEQIPIEPGFSTTLLIEKIQQSHA